MCENFDIFLWVNMNKTNYVTENYEEKWLCVGVSAIICATISSFFVSMAKPIWWKNSANNCRCIQCPCHHFSRLTKCHGDGSLPKCLLLMVYEPKLSMVFFFFLDNQKYIDIEYKGYANPYTWVCTADFKRWLSFRSPGKTSGGDHQANNKVVVEFKPHSALPSSSLDQPMRPSCSFPEPRVGPNNSETFVLMRWCKSELRGSATTKLVPESCSHGGRLVHQILLGMDFRQL